MPVVPVAHPQDRAMDQVNPERLMSLFDKLEERLLVASEVMSDEDLAKAFADVADRLATLHHDIAVLIF